MTARELNASLTYLGVVAVVECCYKLVYIRLLGSVYNLFVGSIGTAVSYVISDSTVKEKYVLRYDTDISAQAIESDV